MASFLKRKVYIAISIIWMQGAEARRWCAYCDCSKKRICYAGNSHFGIAHWLRFISHAVGKKRNFLPRHSILVGSGIRLRAGLDVFVQLFGLKPDYLTTFRLRSRLVAA